MSSRRNRRRASSSSGLADQTGWAQVDPATLASRVAPDIRIIGDANNGAPMPKSGSIANNTAKQAVASAVAALRGAALPDAVYFNTCNSHVGEEYGISVVNIFRAGPNGFVEVPNSGGVSPRGELPEQRRLEALYADAWYASITRDMFG